MEFRPTIIFSVLTTLWLGCGSARCADMSAARGLLVDLDAADFATASDYWSQHTANTGIPGNFVPHGSPTRETVAGAPAVVFDGDGDVFFGPATTAALHAAGAPHTVEIWVFQGNIRDQESMVSWGKRGGPDATFAGFRYGADPYFGAVAMWASTETGYTTLPAPGQWHHLIFTYDGNRQVIYVDGKQDSTKVVGVISAHENLPIMLGAELGHDEELEGKFTHFSGAIGKIRIFSLELDAATVLKRFQSEIAGFPGLSASPLARPPLHRFSFSAPAGPVADGTKIEDLIGGLTMEVRGHHAGFTGEGLHLSGGTSNSEAYLDFPNHLLSTHENITIELWETQEKKLPWSRILSIGTNTAGEIRGPGGRFEGTEALTLFGNVGTAPINRFGRSEGTLLNGGPDREPAEYPESDLGTRFHQVIVYDNRLSEWRWYRNGILMEVIPDTEGPITLSDVNVWLGRSEFANDHNFCGTFREVRVYNRTLDEREIFGNFQAGPDRLNLAEPMSTSQWRVANAGENSFYNPKPNPHWDTGSGPNGTGATATFAANLTTDQSILLDAPVTLGALNLGARNGGGAFNIIPSREGEIIMDSGPAEPGSIIQLPASPRNTVATPLTLVSDVEIANFSQNPLILSGSVGGQGTLSKSGPGPVIITGDGDRFQGRARILTGILSLGNGSNSGSLATTGFTVARKATLVVDRADDLTLSPSLDGDGNFSHRGTGSLTLGKSARLSNSGFVDAQDGSGPLTLEGNSSGAFAIRSDSQMVLGKHSNCMVREYFTVGFDNGGRLAVLEGAHVDFSNGEGALNIGDIGSGQSVMTMEGGEVNWKVLFVGKNAKTSGVMVQNGGTLSQIAPGGVSRIGGAVAGTDQVWGALRLSGGTFHAEADIQVGAYGLGVLEVDGGSATMNGFLGIGRFRDAHDRSGHGLVDVRAGRLTSTSIVRMLLVGEEGAGVLNIRGSGEVSCAGRVIIGAGTLAAPGTGQVNLLQGGSLATSGIAQLNPSRATGFLYLNGGTLKAGGSNSMFMEELDSAIVGPEGAVIDTNGFDIAISQALLAPSGGGLATIPVSSGGVGYLAPPLIEIVGGAGSGATAIANVADGGIHSLSITSPGTGYTSAPELMILGGGAGTGLTLGSPTLAPNKSGGLTKSGLGTLSLSGNCTYTGPTRVLQGELHINGDFSAAVGLMTVAGDASLGGSGKFGGCILIENGATLDLLQPTGLFTVADDMELHGSLIIGIEAGQSSEIEVAGALKLTDARLVVRDLDKEPVPRAQIIASYGVLRGQFEEVSLPPGYSLNYHYGGHNRIAIIPNLNADAYGK